MLVVVQQEHQTLGAMRRQEEGTLASLILRYHMLMLLPLQAVLEGLVSTLLDVMELSSLCSMDILINRRIKVLVIALLL